MRFAVLYLQREWCMYNVCVYRYHLVRLMTTDPRRLAAGAGLTSCSVRAFGSCFSCRHKSRLALITLLFVWLLLVYRARFASCSCAFGFFLGILSCLYALLCVWQLLVLHGLASLLAPCDVVLQLPVELDDELPVLLLFIFFCFLFCLMLRSCLYSARWDTD